MFHANRSRTAGCSVALLGAALYTLLLTNPSRLPAHSGFEGSLAENLDGKPLDPFAASEGRPVVLVFVRTDCPISNRYAPLLQKLSEKFRAKANFWLVYPDRAETATQIKAHLRDYHYSIPALRDTRHALVNRSEVTITPEAAVFSPSGGLLYHGRIDNWYEDFTRSRATATTHELDDAIVAALEGKRIGPGHANAVGCYISDLK
jgi:thiol-disulfide isomerase/thioredoxin